MDFDVSMPSVTEALDDLKRKAQSVQEDGALYAGLDTKARANFERHRAELTQLLQKERAIHAAAEDRLRAELHRLLADAEELRAEIAAANAERERRAQSQLKSQSQSQSNFTAPLATSADALRESLAAARADVAHAAQERTWHELQLREILQQQRRLHDELRRQHDQSKTAAAAAEEERGEREEEEDTERDEWRRSASAVRRAFLPSGPAEAAAPASHHIAAIVSTVERRNRLAPRLFLRRNGMPSPMERRRPSPQRPAAPRGETESARHMAAVCRSLLQEILHLRREYQQCTEEIAGTEADSVEVSRRMRATMGELDRKIHQLRSLRRQQAMVEEKLKLHDMMLEIAAENNYCESVYSDLLELIRT